MDKYLLHIYTWPAMRGVDCELRESYHATAEEAVKQLDEQTEPYAYACLQALLRPGVHAPCDWNGRHVDGEWPMRHGTNGEHPLYKRICANWEALVFEVRERYELGEGGMIDIAGRIMKERYDGAALSEILGRIAAGFDDPPMPGMPRV